MKLLVTCGPGYEPIDEVRRITNFSSGELGVQLSRALARAGHEVFCLKGSGATYPGPGGPCHVRLFHTNDDLLAMLAEISAAHDIAAVFHAAALCDYRVNRVADGQGRGCQSPKIPTRMGTITLTLEPAAKVIAHLRDLFPNSILVGWKYELEGGRDDALAKAQHQTEQHRTEACVLNGRAFGAGFCFCRQGRPSRELRDKAELVSFLNCWLERTLREHHASSATRRQLHAG